MADSLTKQSEAEFNINIYKENSTSTHKTAEAWTVVQIGKDGRSLKQYPKKIANDFATKLKKTRTGYCEPRMDLAVGDVRGYVVCHPAVLETQVEDFFGEDVEIEVAEAGEFPHATLPLEPLAHQAVKTRLKKLQDENPTAQGFDNYRRAGKKEKAEDHRIHPATQAVAYVAHKLGAVAIPSKAVKNNTTGAFAEVKEKIEDYVEEGIHKVAELEPHHFTSSLQLFTRVAKEVGLDPKKVSKLEPQSSVHRRSLGTKASYPESGALRDVIDTMQTTLFENWAAEDVETLPAFVNWVGLFQTALDRVQILARLDEGSLGGVAGENEREQIIAAHGRPVAEIVQLLHDADLCLWEMYTLLLEKDSRWTEATTVQDRGEALRSLFPGHGFDIAYLPTPDKTGNEHRAVSELSGPLGEKIIAAINSPVTRTAVTRAPFLLRPLGWNKCPVERSKRQRDDEETVPEALPLGTELGTAAGRTACIAYLKLIEKLPDADFNHGPQDPIAVKPTVWTAMDDKKKKKRIARVLTLLRNM